MKTGKHQGGPWSRQDRIRSGYRPKEFQLSPHVDVLISHLARELGVSRSGVVAQAVACFYAEKQREKR